MPLEKWLHERRAAPPDRCIAAPAAGASREPAAFPAAPAKLMGCGILDDPKHLHVGHRNQPGVSYMQPVLGSAQGPGPGGLPCPGGPSQKPGRSHAIKSGSFGRRDCFAMPVVSSFPSLLPSSSPASLPFYYFDLFWLDTLQSRGWLTSSPEPRGAPIPPITRGEQRAALVHAESPGGPGSACTGHWVTETLPWRRRRRLLLHHVTR